MPLRFLVTAGPTREPLDDVRFLSNRSTGRMGYAVAAEGARAGHRVVLVSGPVTLLPPAGAERIEVETALQMQRAVAARLGEADVLVMAAAVADFRPAERIAGKRKKGTAETWTLALVRNPDILAGAASAKGSRIHVGFAVESEDLLENAASKLASKNLDLIVANPPASFGAERSTAHFLVPGAPPRTLENRTKRDIASEIVAFCEARAGAQGGGIVNR